ncbi:hypothetical protein E2F51_21155 [Erwinia sp. QL-Z3]|nr:hypothetical protein E2F51_21155 [Erwinia sp. QL-Z3]
MFVRALTAYGRGATHVKCGFRSLGS